MSIDGVLIGIRVQIFVIPSNLIIKLRFLSNDLFKET